MFFDWIGDLIGSFGSAAGNMAPLTFDAATALPQTAESALNTDIFADAVNVFGGGGARFSSTAPGAFDMSSFTKLFSDLPLGEIGASAAGGAAGFATGSDTPHGVGGADSDVPEGLVSPGGAGGETPTDWNKIFDRAAKGLGLGNDLLGLFSGSGQLDLPPLPQAMSLPDLPSAQNLTPRTTPTGFGSTSVYPTSALGGPPQATPSRGGSPESANFADLAAGQAPQYSANMMGLPLDDYLELLRKGAA
jgi:hypothetical protein